MPARSPSRSRTGNRDPAASPACSAAASSAAPRRASGNARPSPSAVSRPGSSGVPGIAAASPRWRESTTASGSGTTTCPPRRVRRRSRSADAASLRRPRIGVDLAEHDGMPQLTRSPGSGREPIAQHARPLPRVVDDVHGAAPDRALAPGAGHDPAEHRPHELRIDRPGQGGQAGVGGERPDDDVAAGGAAPLRAAPAPDPTGRGGPGSAGWRRRPGGRAPTGRARRRRRLPVRRRPPRHGHGPAPARRPERRRPPATGWPTATCSGSLTAGATGVTVLMPVAGRWSAWRAGAAGRCPAAVIRRPSGGG